MRKADFEKNVQEKMQELRFKPTEGVWKRVEASIGEKKRRVLFPWFIAAALLLAVAGYFVAVSPTNNKYAHTNSNQPGQSIANKEISSGKKAVSQSQSLSRTISPFQNNNSHPNDAYNPASTASNNLIRQPDWKKLFSRNVHLANNITYDGPSTNVPAGKNNVADLHYAMPIQKQRELVIEKFAQHHLSPQNNLNSPDKMVSLSANTPSLVSTKKNKLEYGITFSTGLSNLDNRFLISDSLRQQYAAPASGGSLSSGHSGMKNGLSFSIGGTVSKWIGSKLKLGLGLQYQYFSNSMKIGDKIDSAMFLSQNNNVNVLSVNGYYKSNGDKTYHNQYHFISLPIILNWHFSSRFSWENQAVYSRLIATNGLHYDGLNGAYYKDRDLFNNNQFMLATALIYGWSKNKFEVGPQLQYAFTNLMSNGDPKSLRSVGIKANMRLSKN